MFLATKHQHQKQSGSAILAVPAEKGHTRHTRNEHQNHRERKRYPCRTRSEGVTIPGKPSRPNNHEKNTDEILGLVPQSTHKKRQQGPNKTPTPTRRPGRTDHPSFPSGGNCLDLCHTRWKAHEGRVYEEEHCRQEGEGDSEVDEVVHDRTHVVADPQLKPKSVPSTVRGLRQPAYRQAVPRNEKNCVRVWSASKGRN